MRLKEKLIKSFQAPVTVRKFPSSQVYLFKNGRSESDESSEEELDVMELPPRGKEQQRCNVSREKFGDVVLLEREITRDDNLNKLALQYGCKVADIKRVNNFIREQDLYALKSIKIPVKNHGILTETSKELKPLPNAPSRAGLTLIEVPEVESGATGSSSTEASHLTDYFKGIDQNIEEAVQSEGHFNADYQMNVPNWSPLGSLGQAAPSSSGADWGIQWWNAVFIMLLVGIVLPVFYIVYYKTQETGVIVYTSNTTLASNTSTPGLGGVDHVLLTKEGSAKKETQPTPVSSLHARLTRGPVAPTLPDSRGSESKS
uniref:LysM and putative peptidoglycan-binding domain-containing protein 4 n=1 Tax=Sphenodon punctatus TaxID=8508 RepID=A0A8D0GVI5_SPHPU